MSHRRALLALLALAPGLTLSGCCTMARLFCGPDKSGWVQESYETPKKTVATLLEAIKRDEPGVIYRCLSAGFRRANKLDSVSGAVGWQLLREQTPGLHLAGYAEITEPVRIADNGATFELDVEGRTLRIDLVRESFRELQYRRPDGTPGNAREQLASWNAAARVVGVEDPEFDVSRFVFEPFEFEHEGLDAIPLATIERVGLVRLWKVSGLQLPQE
ncbi:MAG: hypothetical protein NXI31_10640 [bacterium]|nr:hypothetical protein [bacterium]